MTDQTADGAPPAGEDWTARQFSLPARLGEIWCRKVDDRWTYAVTLTAEHANHFGIAHGGALMTMMDHGLSMLAWEASGRVQCSTVQLDSQFLGVVNVPAFVRFDGEILRCGRQLVFLRGRLLVDDEAVMESTGIWRMRRN